MSSAYAETCSKRLASRGLRQQFKTSPGGSVPLGFPFKDQPLLSRLLCSLGWSFQTGSFLVKLKQIEQNLHKSTVQE